MSALTAVLEFHVSAMKQMGVPSGFAYSSIYEYVLETGSEPPLRTLMLDEKRRLWGYVQGVKPEIKQCYANSQRLAVFHPEVFTYWEGYVLSERVPIPIHHGWCVARTDRDEVLVDPTLKLCIDKRYSMNNIVIGTLPVGREYFGRAYSREQVVAYWESTHMLGSLVDNPQEGFPYLRAEGANRVYFPKDEVPAE